MVELIFNVVESTLNLLIQLPLLIAYSLDQAKLFHYPKYSIIQNINSIIQNIPLSKTYIPAVSAVGTVFMYIKCMNVCVYNINTYCE